jgi:thermostable 8-oxoguanine DNA glycosylase
MHCIGFQMVQRVIADIGGQFETLELPGATAVVWPGLLWGSFLEPLTPAFWASQAWMAKPPHPEGYRLGRTLREEVIFCLLGGHGAPAEIGLAASRRVCDELRRTGDHSPPQVELERLLREPLNVCGRQVRYRFANQRARYLAGALERIAKRSYDELTDIDLRDALMTLPGVGPKTASWIVRNWRSSDNVAILDVHIVRACSAIGVFSENADPARHYVELEKRFLAFCEATRSRASAMDAVMWSTMRSVSRTLLQQLVDGVSKIAQLAAGEQRGNRPCQDQAPIGMTHPESAAGL